LCDSARPATRLKRVIPRSWRDGGRTCLSQRCAALWGIGEIALRNESHKADPALAHEKYKLSFRRGMVPTNP